MTEEQATPETAPDDIIDAKIENKPKVEPKVEAEAEEKPKAKAEPKTKKDETLFPTNRPIFPKPEEPVDEEPEIEKPAFPDNWREILAGDNKALLSTLKRYASPKSWTDSAFALRQKISSGELKTTLPKNATDEQLTEWRKDNGIPEKPEDYDIELSGGLVIGENDMPMVTEFLKEMHGSNATSEQVKSALTAYYKIEQNLIQDTETKDSEFKNTSEDTLRAEWGGDFKKNVNLVTAVLDTLPEEVADRIAFARTPEGRKLGDDPDFLRAMSQWARDMGIDAGTLMPTGGAEGLKSLEAEKLSIEKAMTTKAYTPEMRTRYAEIVDILDKQKARAA